MKKKIELFARHEEELGVGRKFVIVYPTELTEKDIRKIRIQLDALEKIVKINE